MIRKSARGKDFSHGNRTLISDQRNENSCAFKAGSLKARYPRAHCGTGTVSIGFLAGNKAFAESPEAYDGAGFDEPMMVMAGFSERKLDLFLTEMRRKKVPPIALKAIVTTQNQAWNSLQLYRELKEEHEKMKSYRK